MRRQAEGYLALKRQCLHLPAPLEDEVQVWSASKQLIADAPEYMMSLLSEDEIQRAQRFHFAKDRNQFIASRGLLRRVLGWYVGTDPRKIRFDYSKNGKPELDLGFSTSALRFNVTHSCDVILLAFARGRGVGIDVEKIRYDVSIDEIAERFFSISERLSLRALPPAQRYEAFFRCWTCKEAFVKALGDGLSTPLDGFDVSLAPGEPSRLLQTKPDSTEAERWIMKSLTVEGGYSAALVVEKRCSS
jgi:4'-phosphopantetheinyl transferase